MAIEVEKVEMAKEITENENSIKNLVTSQNMKKNNQKRKIDNPLWVLDQIKNHKQHNSKRKK